MIKKKCKNCNIEEKEVVCSTEFTCDKKLKICVYNCN